MPVLKIELKGDGILKGFPAEKLINIETPVTVTTLEAGMDSGFSSVGIIADLPDGRKVLIQTSARLFLMAASAIRGRYPAVRDF